jgi:hypothetical protein
MSSSFITVVFLLLTRGFLPMRRWSLWRTSNDDDRKRRDNSDRPPSELPVTIAFGRRCHHILLFSSRRPLPTTFLTPAAVVVWDAHWGGADAVSAVMRGCGWTKPCAAHCRMNFLGSK